MASPTNDRFTRSLETGHCRKILGGVEQNSNERPKRMVDLTQASETVKSQRSANKDKRPPIASSVSVSTGFSKGTGPPSPKGTSIGVLGTLSNLGVLRRISGWKGALLAMRVERSS